MANIIVRAYKESDRSAVLCLCREVFGEEKALETEKWMDWEIYQRPFSKAKPIMYVLEKNGELIGNIWCFPIPFHTSQGLFFAYYLSNFMVSPRSRFYGLYLTKKIMEIPKFFYVTNPTEKARKVFIRMGFSSWQYHSVSRSVRWNRKFEEMVKEKLHLEGSAGESFLGAAGVFADGLVNIARNLPLSIGCKGWKCRESDKVDKSLESIHEELKKAFPHGMAERSESFVQWRFMNNSKNSFRLIVLYNSKNEAKGYSFVRFATHGKYCACLIRDWVVPLGKKASKALLSGVIKLARKEKADFIFMDNVPVPYRKHFMEWGFDVEKDGVFLYKNQDPETPEKFMNSQDGAFFTGIEGDNF